MARITTVINQKGGVGKTTTSHAMATGLTLQNKKVLVIDMDPQANISYTMNADDTHLGIYEVLKGEIKIKEATQNTQQGDILSSNLFLAGADMEFTQIGREYLLRDALISVKDIYDYIIIDTPPTLGILTINALTASDDIVVPMGADIYSLQGLAQLYITIQKVIKNCNPRLKISGLLITKYNGRTILSKDLKDSIEEKSQQIGTKVFNTVIRESIAVKEAQTQQIDIYTYAPQSNSTLDYLSFIEEYLKGII